MTLQEAIIGKISHDLAGGIGALINTIDLIDMDASFTDEGLDLLRTAGQTLNVRLKFFRAVYGAENKIINTDLAKDYVKTLASQIEITGDVTTRLQLAMILVGTEILSLGGKIEVRPNKVILSGTELHQNSVYIQALMGEEGGVSPENVSAFWLAHLVSQQRKHIKLDAKESGLVLMVA